MQWEMQQVARQRQHERHEGVEEVFGEAGNYSTSLIRLVEEAIAKAEHAQLVVIFLQELFQGDRARLLLDLEALNNKNINIYRILKPDNKPVRNAELTRRSRRGRVSSQKYISASLWKP